MAEKYKYTKSPIYTPERIGDIKHSILDNKKCTKLLNCAPKTSIESGLEALIL